jgi:two-component sensor histidine kinase
MVNELVTNAFRHAFPDGQPGTVWVQLVREPGGACRLIVADDGCGLPCPLNLSGRIGLGLQMVAVMTEKIGAELSIGRKAGTRFTVTLSAAGRQAGAGAG